MQKFLRYLRISFSATCLIACVLLIVLWVRSYWYADGMWVHFPTDCYAAGMSNRGFIEVGEYRNVSSPRLKFELRTFDLSKDQVQLELPFYFFSFAENAGGYELWVPTWFAILLAASCGIGVWLPWRFNLRTLLIATTLVTVVLGIIVWMSQTG